MKRFTVERASQTKPQSFIGENPQSRFVLLTEAAYPRLRVTYGEADAFRDPLEVDVESFIGVKSYKAKGKRLTTCAVERIEELPPLREATPEPEEEEQPEEQPEVKTADNTEEPKQLSLFDLMSADE